MALTESSNKRYLINPEVAPALVTRHKNLRGCRFETGDNMKNSSERWAKCQGMRMLWEENEEVHPTAGQVLVSVLKML
jgi:hypothetical protein